MQVKKAEFITSQSDPAKCPPGDRPEYAFTGRSNVGKSSLINMLAGRKNLARISGTPGKTRLINHFNMDDRWYLVDLPGYGYAKVSKQDRSDFHKMISDYTASRPNLVCIFVLIDSRHKPQAIDLDFMRWLGENEVPFVMAFTKTDKLSSSALDGKIKLYRDQMQAEWAELPPIFITSATKGRGREEILDYIGEINENLEG